MTSWKKRIENVPIVLSTILNQSKKPDKIVLNLSSDEFRNKERDIPKSVIDFFEELKNVSEIHWVKKNTRMWKKQLPSLKLFPYDCIINIDDDFLYPEDMIETFIHTIHCQGIR